MTPLVALEMTTVTGGGENARTDFGQFLGAYARSLVDHAYYGVFAGTYAFFDALEYALSE